MNEREMLTSHITNSRTTKDADQLRRGTSIVTDGNDIAQWTFLTFANRIENVYQVIGSASPGKDYYTPVGDGGSQHAWGTWQ
jgi:hypothetical protein